MFKLTHIMLVMHFCIIGTITTYSQSFDKVNILLITGDSYGSSFLIGDDKIKSIKERFEEYGWELTFAAIKDTVVPCEWNKETFGAEPLVISKNIKKIKNPEDFDAIVLLPGRGFPNLVQNKKVLKLLKKANKKDVIIAAWCRGVSLLAAADIIRGKKIIGHFDYFKEYQAAGADYVEY